MKNIITRTVEYSFLEKDLVLCKVLMGKEIDVKDVKENFEAVAKLTGGKRYAVLTDGRTAVSISKEAMSHGARPELNTNLIAHAIVVNSLANRLIGNFIIKFHKPNAPTKLFSNPEAGLEWLRGWIQKEGKENKVHIVGLV